MSNHLLANIVTPPLLPLLLVQGYWTKWRTPRLPDASGPASGQVAGEGRALELIVLGESTVAGIGARTHELALTGQTARALAERTRRGVNWLALGRSGITAREALAELVPQVAGRQADVVVIALGVNDALALRHAARWVGDLRELIRGLRRYLENALVLLAGVPPLQIFPALPQPLRFILGSRASVLDEAAATAARRLPLVLHVPFLPEKTRSFFCADGFHPSETGYRLWGEQLAEVAALRAL